MTEKNQFPRKRGQWTELSTELKYDNPWMSVKESKILNPNGGEGIYGVVHLKNFAIGIVPLDEEGNTWIVGQERFPFEGEFSWEIIAGGGPLENDPLDSAKKELLEETGIKAHKWELIQKMDMSNSVTTEQALLYVVRDLSFHEKQPDETEKLIIKKLPFEELYQMVINHEVVDSLSVAAVLKLKLMSLQ